MTKTQTPVPDDEWLADVRLPDGHLPPASLIDDAPRALDILTEDAIWRRYADTQPASRLAACAGRIIAFDLDDTLLLSDYTLGEQWPRFDTTPVPALLADRLRRDWSKTLRGWLRGRTSAVYSHSAHPFLNYPPVNVVLRPGMLGCLRGLRELGATLVLVTASARRRVDYLTRRWPDFAAVFGTAETSLVVCAEELAKPARHDAGQDPLWLESAALHKELPRCLSAKTRWRIAQTLGIGAYDLLVDDSMLLAQLFARHGLDRHLLTTLPLPPVGGYAITMVDAALARLAGESTSAAPPESSSLHDAMIPEGYVPPVLEDPFYMPLLHVRDRP